MSEVENAPGQPPNRDGIGFGLPEYDEDFRIRRPPSGTDQPGEDSATLVEARWLAADLAAALDLIDSAPTFQMVAPVDRR